MGGFFGAVSDENCIYDVFYGTDYHSHLGTRRAGIVMHGEKGLTVRYITSRIHRSAQSLPTTLTP